MFHVKHSFLILWHVAYVSRETFLIYLSALVPRPEVINKATFRIVLIHSFIHKMWTTLFGQVI